jgi:DNA invertase Pin-like site-specific DNA recombinase
MQARPAKYVAYLRVSTDKQGKSGLGLDAQRQAIADFLAGGSPIAEYVEVESGKRDARPQLAAALHRAKVTGARLLIAKLDRLSRNVAFITALQESRVKFVCADMPDATELTVHILAAIAQHERKAISDRTKLALAAAKRRGTKLGNPNGARALRGVGNDRAVEAIKARADAFAEDVIPIIADIRSGGITSFKGIARELNARGILTARNRTWHPATVRSLIARVA